MKKIKFKPISNKISEFSIQYEIYPDDIFICSVNGINGSSYKSYKISYTNLINSYINYMRIMVNTYSNNNTISYFNPKGKWKFTKKVNINNNDDVNNVKVSNKEEFNSLKERAITYEYANKLLNQLEDFRQNYYGYEDNNNNWVQRLPSYIGMVVINDNLSELSQLQNIYGEDTGWKKIPGRYILGAGQMTDKNNTNKFGNTNISQINVSVKRTGGTERIPINELDLVKHSHKFNPRSSGDEIPKFGKLPAYTILSSHVTVTTPTLVDMHYPDIPAGFHSIPQNDKIQYQRQDVDHEGEFDSVSIYGSAYGVFKGGSNFILNKPPPIQRYGSASQDANFSFRPEITSISEDIYFKNSSNVLVKADEEAHTNMHQYYPTYIWERTH